MKKTGKRILSFVFRLFVIALIAVIGYTAFRHLFKPDITGEIRTQSMILEQKLESSQRLEVTKVDEEGVLEAKTNVIIFGTVGSTTIRYRYTASVGIDLSKVIMTADSDRIIFTLPDTEILNDGIEALEINQNRSIKVWKRCCPSSGKNAGNSILQRDGIPGKQGKMR